MLATSSPYRAANSAAVKAPCDRANRSTRSAAGSVPREQRLGHAGRNAHADCVPIPGDVLHSDEPLFATNSDGDDSTCLFQSSNRAATSGSALRETISSRLRSPM